MAKTDRKKITNATDILDQKFGRSKGQEALDEQFTEQAEVAEMLYAARTAAGLTQAELAKLADTAQQVISQLEDADYDGHSLSMLRRIAKALNRKIEIRMVPDDGERMAG